MKLKTAFATTLLCCSLSLPALGDSLTINFKGISEGPGTIYLVMFDSKTNYDNSVEPSFSRSVKVDGETAMVTIADVKDGTYAIKSFLDSNNNRQMDTNLIGLPTEQYGFSNNAGRFGPASFEDAAFKVEGDGNISIRMR